MRTAGLLAALWIVLSGPASALSCLAPSVARDYVRAAQSDDSYIVVKGELFFDEDALPQRMGQRSVRPENTVDIPGWLAGKSLTVDGFSKPFERDVVLRVSCVGPWCGSTVNGPHLAFLKREGRSWVMQISACPGMSYADPSPEMEKTALDCFRGTACAPD